MRFSNFLSACALMCISTAAGALPTEPPPLGTRIPGPNPLVGGQDVNASQRESLEVTQGVGACLVKADPTSSMAYAMAAPKSRASEQAFDKLKPRMPGCLSSAVTGKSLYGEVKLTINPALLRGAIAEALYRLQFALQSEPASRVSVSPILASASLEGRDRDEAIVYEFAQCLADANPKAARSLSLSKIGSREEQAAYAALIPAMSPCLYKGTTLKTDRLTFRFNLAEALYRWSVAAARPASQEQPR